MLHVHDYCCTTDNCNRYIRNQSNNASKLNPEGEKYAQREEEWEEWKATYEMYWETNGKGKAGVPPNDAYFGTLNSKGQEEMLAADCHKTGPNKVGFNGLYVGSMLAVQNL